jgi:hypothetical protein
VSEHPRDEEELQAFLAGESALSRHYKESSGEQPPAHIDSAILAASRWAVGADNNRTGEARTAPVWRRRRFMQWSVPLAMAAVVVLAVALTITIERDPELDRIYQRHDAAVAEKRELNQQPDVVAVAPQAEQEKPAPQQQEAKVSAPGKVVEPQLATEQKAAATKEKVSTGRDVPSTVGFVRDEDASGTEAGERAAMADMARPQEAPEEPPAAPSLAKRQRADGAAPVGSTAAQTSNAPTPALEPEPGVPEIAAVEAPVADQMASIQEDAPVDDQVAASRIKEADAEIAEPFAEQAAPVAPEQTRAQRDAEQWIADIEEQLDRGNVELARAAVKKFHSRYPDYELPDRLAELLPQTEQ